jgi:S1-C subfamily serine protease
MIEHDPSLPTPMPPTRAEPRPARARTVVAAAVLSAVLASTSTLALTAALGGPTVPASGTGATAASTTAQLVVSASAADLATVIARAQQSVVTIATTSTSLGFGPGGGGTTDGVGSGIVLSADGLILTNAHVVSGADSLTVTLIDGTQVPATVVTTDSASDLAVIRAATSGLTPATLGDSASLQVGQTLVAIGTPLGEFAESVTAGILSGTGRTITVTGDRPGRSETLKGLLQTDAAINPGNSGGPLIDTGGRVVGIVTAGTTSAEGVGFAIPIDAARALIAQATA